MSRWRAPDPLLGAQRSARESALGHAGHPVRGRAGVGAGVLRRAPSASPASELLRPFDAVLTPTVRPPLALAKRKFGFRLIVDVYDPVILEGLELLASDPVAEQERALRRMRRDLWLALRSAEHFICASEVQRDMWIGALTTAGRLTPDAYRHDPTLRSLIDVVPFGLSGDHHPSLGGEHLRERFGLHRGDIVLLWGGGIWNWLDPLTLIESVAEVAASYPDTKLVFMGLEHPNGTIGEMEMSTRAQRLSDDLGLTGRHVFFNRSWVPYAERFGYLLGADVGVSIHGDHLESHFAFRTRNLDYLSAGLPVLSTRGDVFADLLEDAGAGIAVAPYDRRALSEAIVSLRDQCLRTRMSKASRELGERFRWDRVVAPLIRMLGADSALVRPHAAQLTRAMATMYGTAGANRIRAHSPVRRG